MNFFQIFLTLASIAAVNMQLQSKNNGALRQLNSHYRSLRHLSAVNDESGKGGGSSGGSVHSSGGSRGNSDNTGGSGGGSEAKKGSHGNSRCGSGHLGGLHQQSIGSPGNSKNLGDLSLKNSENRLISQLGKFKNKFVSFSPKDFGSGSISICNKMKQMSGQKSVNTNSISGSYSIADDEGRRTIGVSGSHKEMPGRTRNQIGVNAVLKSQDKTGRICGAVKREGKRSSIEAAISKQIKINDQTDLHLGAGLRKESRGQIQSHLNAAGNWISKDKTENIIAQVGHDSVGNMYNVKAAKSIFENDQASLRAYVEANRNPGDKTRFSTGLEGRVISEDGTAQLHGKVSYHLGGKEAYDVIISKNLYKDHKVSVDAYGGVKQGSGSKPEGQAGINMKIETPK